MKNYIKKFNSFVNEMAKGDYFQVNGLKHGSKDPNIYGLHRDGSTDWKSPGQSKWQEQIDSEHDEELSAEDFLAKHKDDLGPDGVNWINHARTPETRIKTWKKKQEPTPDRALALIQSKSTDELHAIRTKIEKGINNATDIGTGSDLINKMTDILDKIVLEINSRNKLSFNESKDLNQELVIYIDANNGISKKDIRNISKLDPTEKIKLTGAVDSIASGLYGDLPKRKNNIYKVKEIIDWLDNLK